MIFKTFQTDLDGISNKIGFSKRSFAEWGKQVSNSFKESEGIINNFKNTLKTAFTVPVEKDNSWIKNKLGEIVDKDNINSYIPELTGKKASDLAQRIREQSIAVADATDGWEDYFAELKNNGQVYIVDLIKNTDDLSKLTGEDLVKANQQARASALAHNEAIKAQTFSAKAGKVALQALAMAGNMLVAWGITKGLELAVKGIDNLIHSAEHCKERVDEVMSSYQSTTSSLKESAKEISSLSDRYDQLSKGVGNLGNNISLTEDEFEEYHNITSKIAETYPDLVDGWDAQGNAIVNLTDSVKELNAEYEKSLHNANLTLMESKDDIFKNYENTVNDITKQIEYAEKAMDIVQSKGSFYDVIYDSEGHKTSYYKAFENLGLSVDDMINGNFNTLERQLVLKIQSLKDEMDKAAQDVTPLLNAYLSEDVDYQNISDEKLKTALSSFISSLPESLVTDITENGASAGSNFVEGLVDAVKDDDSVQNALIQLLSLDTENLSYEEAKVLIDNYISIIVNALNSIGYNIDPIELQVELGLDIKNVKEDLRTRLSNGTQDLVIDDWVATLSEDEAKLANSTAFDEALERQKKGLDGATLSAENYSAALDEVKASQDGIGNETGISPLSISQTIDQLNTQLKPAFDSLKSAYQDIFTDDGFTLENVDISMLDSIKSKLDELNELEGANINIDYSSFENLARVLTDTSSTADDVQAAFNSLATDIVGALNPAISECSGENYKLVQSLLESVGIMNSEEVMASSLGYTYEEYIAAKEEAADAGFDLANATESEIDAFVREALESGNCGQALALLQLKKLLVNSTSINTASDIQQIMNLASAAGMGAEVLTQLANAKSILGTVEAGGSVSLNSYQKALDDVQSAKQSMLDWKPVELDFSNVGGGASKAGGAGKDAGNAYVDAFEAELKNLQDFRDRGVIDEAEYLRRLRELYTRYFADRKDYLNEFRKYEREYLEGMKSLYESALSGISKLLSNQIDGYSEAKEAAVSSLTEEKEARLEVINAQKEQLEAEQDLIDEQIKEKQKIIDQIQDEIDAMKEAREERQRQLDLQKAQYEIERMMHQRTILQYSEDKGMHYVNDSSGARDAKEKVDDAKFEIEVAQKEKEIDLIQKEIDLLEEKKDAIQDQIDALDKQADSIEKYYSKMISEQEKYFDSLISNMEKQKSKWEELAEIKEITKAYSDIEQVFGDMGYTVQDILNGNEQAFEDFKSKYISLMNDMNSNSSFAEGLSYATGVAKENLGSFLDKTKETAEGLDELGGKGSEMDSVAESMDKLSDSATTASTNTGEIASNMGELNTNTEGLSDNLNGIGDALTGIPEADKFDTLTTSFTNLGDAIKGVASALGVGEEGTVGGLVGALQSLSELSLGEEDTGILSQFNNLKTAVEGVTSAISGSGSSGGKGGDASGSSSASMSAGADGEGGSGSLVGAIEEFKSATDEALGGGDEEGEGSEGGRTGAIPQFKELKTAVDDVTTAIGSGDAEGGESSGEGESDNLIDSIVNLGETSTETLGESDGDGVIGKFNEFKGVIEEAANQVKSISEGLDEIDGKEVECSITVNVKMNGSIPAFASGTVLGNMQIESATYNAQYGKAFASGTIGLKHDEKNALRSEYGQPELTVYPNGTTELTTSPVMSDLPKGTVIYNEEETKKIMDNKSNPVDNAHADGTDDTIWTTLADGSKVRPLQPGDKMWDLYQKFDAYFKSIDGNLEKLVPNSFYEQNREWNKLADQITYANSVVNNNKNVQQPAINGGINITCPGVTSKEVAQQVGVEVDRIFNGMYLEAEQRSRMK